MTEDDLGGDDGKGGGLGYGSPERKLSQCFKIFNCYVRFKMTMN